MSVKLTDIVDSCLVIRHKGSTDVSPGILASSLVKEHEAEEAIVAASGFQDPLWHSDNFTHGGDVVGAEPVEQHPSELVQLIACLGSESYLVHL